MSASTSYYNRPKAVHSEVTYTCAAPNCDSMEIDSQDGWVNWEFYKVRCPQGWQELFGGIYCPKHKIELRVDGGEAWILVEPKP